MACHISKQIEMGIYTTQKPENKQSFIWNVLEEIKKENNEIVQGIVYCVKCKTTITYNDTLSSLYTHECCKEYKRSLLESLGAADDIEQLNEKNDLSQSEHEIDATAPCIYGEFIETSNIKIEASHSDESDDKEFLETNSSLLPRTPQSTGKFILTTDHSSSAGPHRVKARNSLHIFDKVQDGIYTFSKKRRKGRSFIWEVLADILREDGSVVKGYAGCRKCHTILRYKNHQTSNLNRHKCCVQFRKSLSMRQLATNYAVRYEVAPLSKSTTTNQAVEETSDEELDSTRASRKRTKTSFDTFGRSDDTVFSNSSLQTDKNPRINTISGEEESREAHFSNMSNLEETTTHKSDIRKEESNNSRKNIDNPQGDSEATNPLLKSSTLERINQNYPAENIIEIAEKINAGIYTTAQREYTTNYIWIVLRIILTGDDVTPLIGFVYCSKCRKVLSSQQSNLYRHGCCEKVKDKLLQGLNEDSNKTAPNGIENTGDLSITEQIEKGILTISPREKGKSPFWNIMAEIKRQDGSILPKYLYCLKCQSIIEFSVTQPANIWDHECWINFVKSSGDDNKQQVDMSMQFLDLCYEHFRPEETLTKSPISNEVKNEVAKACATWAIEDCCPLSLIQGSGFAKLAKVFIKLGATYGEHLELSDFLPDSKSPYGELEKLAEQNKNEIRHEIIDVCKNQGASASIAIWSDNYVQRNFISVCLHYQKNDQLSNKLLGIKSMDFQKSTSEYVIGKLKNLFHEFGIQNLQHIKFVCPLGSSISGNLGDYTQLNSSSHLLCDLLSKAFEITEEVKLIVDSSWELCKQFKKCHKDHKTTKNMPHCDISTKGWYSKYKVLNWVIDNWSQINEYLAGIETLKNITLSKVESLVEICRDFEKILQRLQEITTPSLCFVIPSTKKLKALCIPGSKDNSLISKLKRNIFKDIDDMWISKLNIWHKVAFFLYPPAIAFQKSEDLIEIKKFCTTAINEIKSFSSEESGLSETVPSKTQKTNSIEFFFSDLLGGDCGPKITPDTDQEVSRYCSELVEINNEFDAIKWWKHNAIKYPYLSKLALQVLAIPASSNMAEDSASLAARLVVSKKTKVHVKEFDNVVFSHSWNKYSMN
ncbi:uncharacterized protein LOC142222315 [Haematobia irritans]|uniref:uncharacterized protein LOC142222315 n=1 Tax=Haematobia irritans TaxID=7368 RepID=UPI003F50AD1D